MIELKKKPQRSWKDWADFKMTAWEKAAWTGVMLGAVWAALVSALAYVQGDDFSILTIILAIMMAFFGLCAIWGNRSIREQAIRTVVCLVILAAAGTSLFLFIWSATNVSGHQWDMT